MSSVPRSVPAKLVLVPHVCASCDEEFLRAEGSLEEFCTPECAERDADRRWEEAAEESYYGR